MSASTALVFAACLLAAVFGMCSVSYLLHNRSAAKIRSATRLRIQDASGGSGAVEQQAQSISSRIVASMGMRSRMISLYPQRTFLSRGLWMLNLGQFSTLIQKTGLDGQISQEGFCDLRARLSLSGAVAGVFVGMLFSTELSILFGIGFLAVGWHAPLWALKQVVIKRKEELENHLSEMIEVVTLGLRSGLSFDHAFSLYNRHFNTSLALESRSAQQQWQIGLATREEVLRRLASSYDSLLFSRVIENIVRSLRFGSSMAASLEASAAEARMIHKAHMEEKVAKAPVKMLIPTAALILPAMLLLVLGPVLLELVKEF